jgi:4-amino-4-deoxychorismate lyase
VPSSYLSKIFNFKINERVIAMVFELVNEVSVQTFKNGTRCDAIDPLDRAFLYGDGLFTSVRVSNGESQLWSRHLQRLKYGAHQLGFDINFTHFEIDILQKAKLLHHGILKIIISRGSGARGYLPPQQPAVIYIQLFPSIEESQDVVCKLPIISGLLNSQLGQVMPQLAGLKTLNRLEQVLLRRELASYGWKEGLVCDANDWIIEGVYSNCFFLVDGVWWTPPINCSGILGVMRAEVIERMQSQSIPLCLKTLRRDEDERIEALFFCNTLTQIVPVSALNDRELNLSAVTSLANLLF